MKIIYVVGVRPNLVKVSALWRAASEFSEIEPILVHTGQHDLARHSVLMSQLGLPCPDYYFEPPLNARHAMMGDTTRILTEFESLLSRRRPDLVVVVGDVDSTLACAMVANRMRVPLAHVEAGLRSGNRAMPEENNRILTDHMADYHYASYRSAVDNLRREGISPNTISLVGNTAIDTLEYYRSNIERSLVRRDIGIADQSYVVATSHRDLNVGDRGRLKSIVAAVKCLSERVPIVFPLHEKTRARLNQLGLLRELECARRVRLLEPLNYYEFIHLLMHSRMVLTDSGGIQDEAAYLKVPCLTLREETERPETVEAGANHLVGVEQARILSTSWAVLEAPNLEVPDIGLADAKAGLRITESLLVL